ncbi:1-phosphofructokinase family hexose kinase [Hydrogenophaga sp. PBL-H3]|uniref:1-phosphofructokinase family hexose kinase n=1 Tax=Hydrogenophaga sp. PBL-H3 TaxID=434010 RepID=UPI00132005FB|nr:1-phosphofructokinase family hexose kinase [Hydrogenophaga sp. PBL-H3]QHE78216.1 1-phosphofructokinase family hexose kinase [Hydrogenophaga sp. PBL-H3]QHE82640.1 1-phosphofructokinase family hexose kinase [Hydrogenophaga sp. PBL-H3]
MSSLAGTVLCLTMNPSVDVSTHADRVVPADKLRCGPARRDAGGGGLNVASVVHRMGGHSSALYPAGGAAGQWLTQHLVQAGLPARALPIAQDTRENFTVQALDTGAEYRFVLPGPTLAEAEWQACLDGIDGWSGAVSFVVASGSLPPGVPADFYARLAGMARQRGVRLVLDSSGPALAAALQAGVFLAKPNLRELRELTGLPLDNAVAWRAAAQALIDRGQAEVVALTMGDRGALLLTRDGAWQAEALPVEVASSVGAGDSFVGALVWSLQQGHPLPEAFSWAMAAGSAALLTPGTGLCLPQDVQRLQPLVQVQVLAV